MLKKIILIENTLDRDSWEEFETDDICEFLKTRFDQFPTTGKIYHGTVAKTCDVTPFDEASADELEKLEGVFFVVIYPGEVAGWVYLVAYVVLAIASYAYARSLEPPTTALRNTQTESPNNGLSDRQNQQRINGRIPDIFGTVRSTPDLLAVPYKVYENNIEVEYSYMCVGRGEYEIPAENVRDDTTPVSQIEGVSVEVFAPFTSPNSGDEPQLRIGNEITEPIYEAKRLNSVNGQVLKAQDAIIYVGTATNGLRFKLLGDGVSGVVQRQKDLLDYFNFADYFAPGDSIELVDAVYSDGPTSVDLGGVYTVYAVDRDEVGLSNAPAVNSDWALLTSYPSSTTGYVEATIQVFEPIWVGPFTVISENLEKVFSNFVALNGLFIDSGTGQSAIDVEIQIGLTPVNSSGTALASESFFSAIVEGSATQKSIRAVTAKIDFGIGTTEYAGFYKIRARRVTSKFKGGGTVADEIKWQDLYSMANVPETDFGNVTTVHSVTQATEGALAVKSRKLNMLVTRKIPQRISGDTFTTELFPTNRADEILAAVCLDPYIGGRDSAEVDFDNIYSAVAEIEAYFGIEKAVEFNYTFDSDNLSFEETVAAISSAIHSKAFRRGNEIKLKFEKETEDSVLLFNHRNKLPGSETRTIRFGNEDNFDGIELQYTSDVDDAVLTYYIPSDRSAKNPSPVETIGIRGQLQAYFHAWRVWNKIRYQNIASEFEATQEADLLVIGDRILVADNTRSDTQDGEIVSQNGLELGLSQPATLTDPAGYLIFLQHTDGLVESIAISAGSDSYHVILATAPRQALYLETEGSVVTLYQIVGNSSAREQAFLVSEKEPQGNFTSSVTAINYDARYYTQDSWYGDGIINEEGEANQAGDIAFNPPTGLFILSEFPLPVAIIEEGTPGVGHVIRYSKTAIPTDINDGTLYETPVDVNDGETLYARAFTPIDSGDGASAAYNSVPNFDFSFETNSQYISLI